MTQETFHILLVDDDPASLMLLRKFLEDAGHRVTAADSGAEVLERVKQGPPDLFLLDVVMPDMDGLEVCKRLKDDGSLKNVPVIFITARTDTEDLVKGFQAGGADYITKPANKAELLARVTTHARLRRYMLELERLNQLALDANPNTGLPGNNSINEAITRAVEGDDPLAVIYCDLDGFKAFNDKYGFARGDGAIKYTASVIHQCMDEMCGPGCFIGHIGGDDFTVIVPSHLAEPLAKEIARRFDAGVASLYDTRDLEEGGIVSVDRLGNRQKFPVMSISLAGVDLSRRSFSHYLEVANTCAEVKKVAKDMPGSSVFFDRRDSPRQKT